MLELNTLELSELQTIMVIKGTCCNCTAERIIETQSLEDAAQELHDLGWRAYQTDEEVGPVACPLCISGLKQIEQEE